MHHNVLEEALPSTKDPRLSITSWNSHVVTLKETPIEPLQIPYRSTIPKIVAPVFDIPTFG